MSVSLRVPACLPLLLLLPLLAMERNPKAAKSEEPSLAKTLMTARGQVLVADPCRVDDRSVLHGSSAAFDVDTGPIPLITGGSRAWSDDLTIREATPDAKWEKRRPLLQQKEKYT